MHIEKREDPNPNFNYEVRDINVGGVRLATYLFFGFFLGSVAIGYIFFVLMNPAVFRQKQGPVAMADRNIPAYPNPLLQDNVRAKVDMHLIRQREEELLAASPSQLEEGNFRIPVNAAMEILAQQGMGRQGVRIVKEPRLPGAPPAIGQSVGGVFPLPERRQAPMQPAQPQQEPAVAPAQDLPETDVPVDGQGQQ
jgi:hypothetical protein